MARNRKFADVPKTRTYPVASGVVSGDPVAVGQMPGVALNDRDADGESTVQLDGSFNLSVASIDSSGASAADANVTAAVGDIVYFGVGDTPQLSKRAGGIRFGYLEQTMTSGQTATKQVRVGY